MTTRGKLDNRLERRLAPQGDRRPRGLAPYVTAGDGGMATTLAVLRALDAAGAVCVELGLPFSDPIADGPVLQAAAQRALQAGTRFERVLEMLATFRAGDRDAAGSDLPVVLMSYANPLLRRGWEHACHSLAQAGADGLLVADVPVEEGDDLRSAAQAAGLCPIFFVAPTTTPGRMARAVEASRGFVYAIGRTGVTGAATLLEGETRSFLGRVRARAGDLPVAVGFGLATAQDVRAATAEADLAIVGSALVDHIYRAAPDGAPDLAAEAAARFVRPLVEALSP